MKTEVKKEPVGVACDTCKNLRIYSLWSVGCVAFGVKIRNGYHARELAERCGKYEVKGEEGGEEGEEARGKREEARGKREK